jgi:hypothetical protein
VASVEVVEGRVLPVIDGGMSPALMWDESHVSADGAALACPLCGWPNVHLAMCYFATPSEQYTPVVGVDIDARARWVVVPGRAAMALHGGKNRGPMLAVGYWCETGCQGRIELREHKGNVFLSLHAELGFDPADMVTHVPAGDGAAGGGDCEPAAPPF